jgi:hypothetical protein
MIAKQSEHIRLRAVFFLICFTGIPASASSNARSKALLPFIGPPFSGPRLNSRRRRKKADSFTATTAEYFWW